MRRTDAVQSTFSKTDALPSRDDRALSHLESPMDTRFHDAHPLRPANSAMPLGILFRVDVVECVASDGSSPAAPRDALRNRREPRRATSLDRFHKCCVNSPCFHDPSRLPSPGSPKALHDTNRLFTDDTALDALSPAAAYAVLG